MAHPPRLTLAGLLLGFLIVVAPSEANKCKTGCHGMHTSKAYQEGRTYTYQLDGHSVSAVTDAQGEASLKLNAIVELAVKPDCVHQIRLKNVKINGASASQGEIERHALQFNYHNGHIDTEVCAEPGDTQSALNVKRAVISLFQDAVVQDDGSTTHHETDVFGGCPTDFTFSKNGETKIIKKYRNLEQCSYRENIKQDLISATFNSNSNVKSTPLLIAEQRVEQQFNRGILQKASSTEFYKYRPFSNGDAGAKTVVETTLTFKGESAGSGYAQVSEPKSLIFEAPHQVVQSSVEAITKALQAAKESMPDAVTPFAARRFAELIKVLRQSSRSDISTVYSRVKAGAGFDRVSARKVLLDALFRTGTGEAAEALVELVRKKDLSPLELVIYYTSLGFLRHANLASVTTVTSLLDEPNLPRMAYLGIGSLIGKYCQEHNCENIPEVNAALAKISSKLTKATNRDEEKTVISALKALGNARFLDDATLMKIAKIATDKSVHNRVRVAALEALPTRCSMKWKSVVFPTLADRDEDSEIRIKTYLSLVACPCPHVASKLKEVLDKETINQVGSFITSHLRNLRASTNPDKEEAKRQLGLIKPRTKFPEDFRKFSYNNELSYMIDAFGIGSSVESNVIYSQNSFVPRSASLNLTTEIFGHSFNFMELNGRVENLDRLIEEYLGPKGILRPENVKGVVVDGRKTFDAITASIADRFNKKVGRQARHASIKEIDNFGKRVHLPDTEVNDNLELDLSIKLFGAELVFLSHQGSRGKFDAGVIIDEILNILESGVDKAKNFDYHFKNHMHFLDAELVYPTGLGFPLTLGVVGTSAVHLKTSGKIDLVAIYKNPKSTAIQIALEPSASIRIAGSMVVEGYGVESGLKVISTLHTATGSDVSVKFLEGNGIDINFGIPRPKQELISVTSEVLISSGAKGDNYVAPKFSKGQDHADCFDQLSSIIGLTVCGKFSFPYDSLASVQKKPLFPLSGPATVSVYLEHNDVRSYHFKAYYNTENPKARSVEILLETPNSRNNRRISLLVEGAIEPEKLVRITFDSPWKKASAEAVLKNRANEQTLTLTVHHDNIEYFIRTGIVASGSKYRPVLEYKVPDHVEKLAGVKNGVKNVQRNGQQYTVGGVIDVGAHNGGKKYVFDKVFLASGGQSIISIDGTVSGTSTGGGADLEIEYGGDTLLLKGNTAISGPLDYKTELSIIPTKYKVNSFSLSFESKGVESAAEQTLIIVHGSDLNSQTNRITYHGKHSVKYTSPQDFDISAERKITYPAFGLVVDVEGVLSPKNIGYDFAFKYDKFNLESKSFVKTGIAKPGDFEVEFGVKLQSNSIVFQVSRAIITNQKNKFVTLLELQPGGKYELQAVVDYDVRPENINTQLDAELKVNGKKILIEMGLEVNPNKVNSRAVINAENTKYLEFVLTLLRGTSPNGNIKLNIKNYFTANGQFRFQHGSAGDAQIEINIPKFNRKITGHGEVSIVGSKHVATVEILYDAAKDPKKRIKFSTDNDFTPTSFDTKNVLEVLDYKTVVNAKGSSQGQIENGRQNAEFDITLPNGRYIVGKGSRTTTTENELMDGEMQIELIDYVTKGGQSRKFIYHPEVHNLNVRTSTFEAKHDLQFINFDGGDVKLLLWLKNILIGTDEKGMEVKFELKGSKIPSAFSFVVAVAHEINGARGTGTIQTALGQKLSLEANGKYELGNQIDKPTSVDAFVNIRLPSEKLKSIRFELADTYLIPKEVGGRFELIEKSQLTYNDDKTIKFDSHFTSVGILDESHIIEEAGKLTVTVLNNSPMSVGYTFKNNPINELTETIATLDLNCGNKQTALALDCTHSRNLGVFNIIFKAITPIEKLRNLEIKLQHKDGLMGPYGQPSSRKTDLIIIADGVKYTASDEYEISPNHFSSRITGTSPGENLECVLKVNKLGEKEFTGDFKYKSSQGFVNLDGHVNMESLDVFSISGNLDTDKANLRKIHFDIANKLAKGGKRIQISISSDGKNIVAGSTNYKKHLEGGKITVEGSGSLKIKEDTKSSSFKYTHQELSADVDGEKGADTRVNFNFGQSSIVGEFKATNKEIHILNSYCEQNADCAQFNLQYKTTNDEFKQTAETTVEVDLRKFNIPYEFGLKSTDVVDLQSGFDRKANLYLHSSKEKMQYSYHVYGRLDESGIVLTLPSRELALIASVDIPKNKRAGAYKLDISSYLDRKRRPKEKTSLVISGDVVGDKNAGTISGDAKFTYPSQTKDLSVKGKIHFGGAHILDANLDIDVFAKRNQKIIVLAKIIKTPINEGYNITGTTSVISQGQRLNVVLEEHFALSRHEIGYGQFLSYTDEHRAPKSTGILFSANLQEAHLLIRSPDQELIKADSKIDLTKNLQKIHTDVVVFGKDPIVINLEFTDMNTFKYLYQPKNNPKNRVEASGRIVPGQLAEVHADSFKDGAKKGLFHIVLHLDERRYLKPDLDFNKNNIAELIDTYRTRIVEMVKLADQFMGSVAEEIITELKDLLEHLKKAKPNLKPLLDYYVAQLNQLKDELNIETEGIKQFQQKFNAIFGSTITAITESINRVNKSYEEIYKLYVDFIDRLNAAFKAIQPELQKSWRVITATVTEIFEEFAKIVSYQIKTYIEIFNAHKEEFKQIATIGTELVHDIATIIWKASSKIQTEINEFFTVLIAELKALPIHKFIQEKYKELLDLKLTNAIITVIDEAYEAIKRILPTKALKDLLTSVHYYTIAVIKQEKVDDIQELKKLYNHLLQAIQSIIELVQSQSTKNKFFDAIDTRIPFDFSGLAKIPGVPTLKVSALYFLRNREWPTLNEVFYAYRPTSDAGDLIPPFSKFAVFLDGGHFFTFDGRHLTLPGKCSYVLAQDARDGNFSIVAELNDGKLTSVTVTEPTESITIQSTGTILVNNQPAEFPTSTKNLEATLRNPMIIVSSSYGVKLHCNRKAPLICSAHVSGFYHGRLRGILGNGNNEPWDDFILPSGKVTESESDFGNAFKLNPGCSNVRVPDHHSAHHRDATCTEFFTGKSPLSACFNYVDPSPYRQACDHASSAGAQKEGACLVAVAYYSVCREARVSVKVPTTCGSCLIGNEKIDIGTSFSVQHPKQQADIIFVLEQASENSKVFHELIVPLIPIIKNELKDNGITDVHIGLIGFGDQLKHPLHYTFKGSTNIGGDIKNIKFVNRKPIITYEEAKTGDLKKRLEYLAQKVEIELGTSKLTAAYEEALAYEFRPGASKTVVGVLATPCEKSPLPISLQQVRLLLGHVAYNDLGLTYHQIAPLDDILISGKAIKNVVGFDSDSVFTFADSRKKHVEGSAEQRNHMVLASNDVCAIFAADSGGAAFSAHNYFEAKPGQKKQFLQVAGRRLVSSLINTEIKEDCVCRQQYGVYPRAECKIVSRKEKEPVVKRTKGGVKG